MLPLEHLRGSYRLIIRFYYNFLYFLTIELNIDYTTWDKFEEILTNILIADMVTFVSPARTDKHAKIRAE